MDDRYTTDPLSGPARFSDVVREIDRRFRELESARPLSGAGASVVTTSTSRPSHAAGTDIYETDTGDHLVSDGTSWIYLDGPGDTMDWYGATAPANHAFMYGQAISRTTYVKLFTKMSTTHGVGDGTTTFNLPDLRGRVGVGLDNMGGTDAGRLAAANTLGAVGGAETHTLTTGEMPAHTHDTAEGVTIAAGFVALAPGAQATATITSSTGGGGAHNNLQPYLLGNKVIRLL